MDTITKQQWEQLDNDYKSIINGEHYVLKLTNEGPALVQVKIVD